MSLTASEMLPLGTSAPDFNLPDTEGKIVSLDDFKAAKAFLVIFMCNHCPFVKHILNEMVKLIKDYQAKSVAVVAINSNDVVNFPDDSPVKMAELVKKAGFTFPYLYDETQVVAQAYHAACTPDFFLFDSSKTLVYRGQMDNSRPGNGIPVTGADLTAAINAVIQSKQLNKEQKPSMGCNIKWKQ
ncbi:MAG: thioredoxin family protein [Sedimentisphaerales bacterium]|nr:thioredoxin family protein [Sedimentisphaerales bacterium]